MDQGHTTAKGSPPDARNLSAALWPQPLLPNEPRIIDLTTQAALTAQFLLPALTELEACLLAVRRQLDPELHQLQPIKRGKPYPLGQCLEIALAVQKRLRTQNEASLTPAAATGLRALHAFQRAGGTVRQVWGDLRGQYFQNAFQIGTLYVDVANDTVVPTKPKVEILPFAQAQFVPIRDFRHFSQIASSYWQDEIYPNHVLPTLAPHCPLIHVSPNGRIKIQDTGQYMLALTRTKAFQPSETVLGDKPIPQVLFDHIRRALQGSRHTLPLTPEQGRQQALEHCRQYRAKRWHQQPRLLTKVIQDVQQINRRLAQHPRNISLPAPSMPIVKIDNMHYELDNLPPEAKAQLQHIQFVDQELARLQEHVIALQTARNVYLDALKASLSPAGRQVTDPT